MPTPLLVLFYLWVAGSVVILGYRLVTRRRRSPRAKVVKASDLASRPAPEDAATTPVVPPASAPPSRPPDLRTSGPDHPPAPPTPPAATASPTAGSGDDPRPAASLMEALAGITLPCDLLPLTTVEGRTLGSRELLLVTSDHPAPEVGRALADAIAALGYDVTPLGDHRALASRGPDQITLILHDRPETVLAGTRPAFPTTRHGDVIVELRL